MKPIRLPLFAALILAAATPLAARADTFWMCGLSQSLDRLVCVADTDALPGDPPPTPVARVNGTAFPLDPRRPYEVPLWSPPTEPEFVQTLAEATICYRTPACQVWVHWPQDTTLTRPRGRNGLARR